VRCLFTYRQTEGDELPPAEVPEWSLTTALEQLDIKRVPYTSPDGNTQGVSWERSIAINPVAAYPLKTTVHEVAHVVSGHTAPDQQAEYQTHRGQMEFEAEATAHLVLRELDVLTDEQASVSRGYVQSWMRGERPPEASIRKVFSNTTAILRAGRLAIEGGDDA